MINKNKGAIIMMAIPFAAQTIESTRNAHYYSCAGSTAKRVRSKRGHLWNTRETNKYSGNPKDA